jgi:glycosyltransferase involved in cell wall biosynthesis
VAGLIDIQFEDRFASEDELIDASISCDVVLAPYLHHTGGSSVAIWAAAAGRPILTQNSGSIANAVTANGLGVMCDPTDPAELAAAITVMVNEGYREAWQSQQPREFAVEHSADHFYSSIVDQLALCKR